MAWLISTKTLADQFYYTEFSICCSVFMELADCRYVGGWWLQPDIGSGKHLLAASPALL